MNRSVEAQMEMRAANEARELERQTRILVRKLVILNIATALITFALVYGIARLA